MSVVDTYSAIIVAIIGLLGTLLPVFYNSNLNINDDPLIEFSSEAVIGNSLIFNVRNIGNTIATNISLYIDSSSLISNLTNIFSATEITYNNKTIHMGDTIDVNNYNIKLDVPKLIQGDGSDISLKISFSDYLSESDTHIDIKAIYDQGSSESSLLPLPTVLFEFHRLLDTYYFPELGSTYLILFSTLYVVLIYYLAIRPRRRRKYFEKILASLIAIRNILYLDRKSNKKIDLSLDKNQQSLEELNPKSLSETKLRTGYNKKLDIEDIIRLNNLYIEIQQRNLLLRNTKTNEIELNKFDVEEINNELIKILDEVLLKINWKKYL